MAKTAGVLRKSFVAATSGSENTHGGGSGKGNEVFSDGFPKSREYAKPNLNLNGLTINMENYGHEVRDMGIVNISINLELIYGPNGEWSVHKAYIGDNLVSREPSKSGYKTKEGNGPNEASSSSIPKPNVNNLNPMVELNGT